MELTNEFTVEAPVERAWEALTDIERIAPCMPGAQLTGVAGDVFTGEVKVKVGPITARYRGEATLVERDEAAHRAVLEAAGRDTRGQGSARATVTMTLREAGAGTAVTVVTDLDVTGKVAQFGRGVMAAVSAKLLAQFVAALERDVLAAELGAAPTGDATAPPVDGAPASSPRPAPDRPAGPRTIDGPEVAPIDLLDAAGSSVGRRAAPLAAVAALLLGVWLLRRRRRR